MGDANLLERILDGAEDPTNLSLTLLQDITDNFSEERKIGQGGFGEVYKGVLRQRTVAVKRIYINENTVDDRLFRGEFASLWNTNNRNVVRILGVCSEVHHKPMKVDGPGELIWANVLERLLCFEYVSNGSLDKHTTDELRGFEWETRYEIITGICKGLRYLHEEKKMIHMDLKPANILLHHQHNKYMVPKITDFGLSRPNEKSHTMGKRYGTLGYMAPEYREHGETRRECDIYSLGAIIIELVTGCKDVPNKDNVLRRWRHRWKMPPTQLQYQQVTRCIDIAGRCRKQDPNERPSISKIISFLGESESTHGQIIPLLDEDDMLGIKPLELQLPSNLNKGITRSIELTNGTRKCIAFNIQLPNPERYSAQPVKGIMRPGSKYDVKIIVQERDVHRRDHADKFIVKSMKASEGLVEEEITELMSRPEVWKVVDEVDLMVVYEPMKPLENSRSTEDTNMPYKEFPEAKKRNTGESPSGKGKHKLGSSENAEASSMDTNSSMRGQYTKQLDRHNFHPPENFSHNQATNMTYLLRDSDRAMDVTRGAMGSLLHKLGVLHKEFNLETSVKKDADELVMMQHVLRKVSNVQQDNLDDLVRRWSCDIREMSYGLEDFVDGFLVHNEPNSDGSSSMELTHEMCFLLEKGKHHQAISDLIKHHISKQVQDAAEKCKEYRVDNIVPNASANAAIDNIRILSMYEDSEKLIGIEMRRYELIRIFEEGGDISKQDLRIVSIVGLGGLGKTTLAKAVYDKLKAHHDLKAFVSVGQNPDVKEVLKNIIGKFEAGFKAENLGELVEKLQELLEDKRYCIVIDDIWDLTTWNSIKFAFPKTKSGSIMITTTRSLPVARACCNNASKYIYSMKALTEEESRRLFLGRAFVPENDCPITPRKEEISKYILKTCGGMPLAINSIASLLAGKPDSTWENVWKSLGALTEGNTERDTPIDIMKQILDLSYIHLPDHLKTCLLHVCMYPEDRNIDNSELLKQWVAEGFVSTNGRLDAEDVAENYFVALINMCMIQPGKIDYYTNEVLSCRVHDIILDLMRSKSSQMNFIHVIDGFKDVSGPRGEIRRALVQYNVEDDSGIIETIEGSLSHVRSLLLSRCWFLPDFQKCKYVRVLHLEEISSTEKTVDLTGINSLFLLRYLKFQCWIPSCKLKLPDKIGQLQQLETINLQGCVVKNYPSDIVTLPRLLHLSYSGHPGIMLPYGIERLKSLHTLVVEFLLTSSVESIKGLGELTNLRNLEMCLDGFDAPMEEANLRLNALQSSSSKISSSLRILKLHIYIYTRPAGNLYLSDWTIFPQVSHIRKLDLSECPFERFPECIHQLHNLYSFSIKVRVVADGVSIVARLPLLAYFRLEINRHEKQKDESVVISGFKALTHLRFYCQNVSLTFEEGALPKLEKLDILFPLNIIRRSLPVGIQHLPAPTLKQICLRVNTDWVGWKVRGSEHWEDGDWGVYWRSVHYRCKLIELERKSRTLVKRAFKLHHPSADIVLHLGDYDIYPKDVNDEEDSQEVGVEEGNEDGYDDENYCMEGYYWGEYDEVVDSGRMNINADVPPMVDTSLHLAVRSECRQSGCTKDLESLQLPFKSLLDTSPSYLRLTLALCSSPDTAEIEGVDLNQVPIELNEEEDEEDVHQVNASQTSAQVQANTRQLIQLIEEQQDSGRMLIETDAPPLVDTSLHLAIGSEVRQNRCTEDSESVQLPSTNQRPSPSFLDLTLALHSSPDTAQPVAHFPVDISNDLLAQQGNNGMQVNAVGQHLDLNQGPQGGLVDPNQAPNQLNDLEMNEEWSLSSAG
ncbi:unnamed protein product [Alopecurus aequalis]